ncbi:hypothetical protein Cob_v000832 [Colletotrichum orbiculare MAFF 240422]|uniref:Glycoside hydrolase n=1 Tax=Colletotrichum orbiculare (strain 104-T / ATCC 96160 / CBS 514.97 / LARS 414 / MAFF 240422) TaxID=1213857 RepID=A0A484G5W3_COLOR|nr:hypothetical protein Cob_v000832 [Colletotrichum orbiculare MAFF 240422]
MAVQLPPEELGTAVAILVYSFFCLACSCTMAWLTHVHREAISYVALVSYFTGLSTAGSIAQQLHTLVRWRDIKLEQFHHSAAHVGNPELAIAGQSTGLDLVLFYIQFYCYNVEAALTFFWRSIFQLEPVKSRRRRVNYIAKGVAVLLPALLMGILRLEAVQQRAVTFLILADSIMGFCLSGSGALLIVILVKYMHTRKNLLSWNVRYGQRSDSTKNSDTTLVIDANAGRRSTRSIYDRWLVVRFSIAFVSLAIFQVVTIMFQVSSARQNTRDSLNDTPDLSTSRLHTDLVLFLPGVSASLLTFVVFGTTKTFRDYLVEKLVPGRVRSVRRRGGKQAPSSSPRRSGMAQTNRSVAAPLPPRLSLDTYVENDFGLYTPTDEGSGIQLRELNADGSSKAEDDDQSPLVPEPGKPERVYLYSKSES